MRPFVRGMFRRLGPANRFYKVPSNNNQCKKIWSQLEFLYRDHGSSGFYIPFFLSFSQSKVKSKFYFWFFILDIYKCPILDS